MDTKQREGCVRVAFASSDNITINDHFGRSKSFLIFDVSSTGYFKAGKVQFSETEETKVCNPENKHFEKIKALSTCHIVYSQSIGGPVAARLIQQKIHPMVAKDNPTIESILTHLKVMLGGTVPPWMRKITGVEDPRRFESF